jgi:hypothetical protein
MMKANKPPSEWLRLLCKDWASENEVLVETADAKFLEYKPYLKGLLTSQLLCRLSTPALKDSIESSHSLSGVDFWGILGVEDEFDKSYIIAQVERFSALYSIRGGSVDESESIFGHDISTADPTALAAAAAAGISVSPGGGIVPLPSYLDAATAAAAAAASTDMSRLSKKQVAEVSKAHRMAKDAEKALENERRLSFKREQRRISQERRDQKHREREAVAAKKAAEKAAKEAAREERRQKKVAIRDQREKFANEQKEAALQRAAELVASNRVPIEITRGAAAAKAAASAVLSAAGALPPSPSEDMLGSRKKPRSAIVVSTASDLHRIVTHSKNLWAKYNAIAKEHSQKVNWITVAKELGIHVKVREKYARMHSRAEQRGFDWVRHGHWKLKDHPDIFLEPTPAEQRAKMPAPLPDPSRTVLIEGNKEVTDEAVAAAAAVVDASVTAPSVDSVVVQTTSEHTEAAAAVAATLVADPTAGLIHDDPIAHV